MIILEVDKSGKAIVYKDEVRFLPVALIPHFIMFAGKTVEIKVDPGGPFTCVAIGVHKQKETIVFELNKYRFRICSDIACQTLGKGDYEVGKTYHLAVAECKKTVSRKPKSKSKKGTKVGK